MDSSRRPQVCAPEAIAALDFYRRIISDVSICHPTSPQLDSTQSGDRFLSGEVAMMVNWFGFAARSDREGSSLGRKVAIARIPSQAGRPPVSLSVFWALAMGSGSKKKETAWEFLRFVARPEHDLGMTKHGTVGVRLSTWRDAALQARIPAYSKIESISLGARQLPAGPKMADFAQIIDSVVIRALTTTDASLAILESCTTRNRKQRNCILMSTPQHSLDAQPFRLDGRHALVTGWRERHRRIYRQGIGARGSFCLDRRH
jgi:multiple sugar transport system substrate-binding protein